MKKLFILGLLATVVFGSTSCRRVLGTRSWAGGTFTAKIDGVRWKAHAGTINYPAEGSIGIQGTGSHGTGMLNIGSDLEGTYNSQQVSLSFGVDEWNGQPADQIYMNASPTTLAYSDLTLEVITNNDEELEIEFEGFLFDKDGNSVEVKKGRIHHKKMAE
ncbi:MAG: hypothetical protein KDC92_11155 [Bacteroidetes bacterium]|nr:hypothetical protein [Bacteroidota bacterium]